MAPQPDRVPPLLLADTSHRPRVQVSWPTRAGRTITLEGFRPYRSPAEKQPLGTNISAYVALGGTRLERGQGHRDGAIVLLGLYKDDAGKLFFQDIADNATVRIVMSGVRMNQPARIHDGTGLMHLRYMVSDLDSCGIDASGRNLFITEDPADPIGQVVVPGSAKLGMLDGKDGHGKARGVVEKDGSISIHFEFPYHLLRHIQDPYQRTIPGGFFEPTHFHVEMELLPAAAAGGDGGN
jgi:hypothetical protein